MLRCRHLVPILGVAAITVSMTQAGAVARPLRPTAASAAIAAAPGSYAAVPQVRVLDTRAGVGTARHKVAAGQSVTVAIAGRSGVPSGASAVALTVTATGPTRTGYVTAYPAGTTRPGTSVLDVTPGATVADLALVPVGAGGGVTLYNGSAGTLDLVADVSGYVVGGAATTPGTLSPVTPARVLDTRRGLGAARARLKGHASLVVTVAGHVGVPRTGASAAALVVTAVAPSGRGYLTVTPASAAVGATSTVNFSAGQTVANSTLAALDGTGRVRITNGSAAPLDIVADVTAFARAGSTSANGTYAPLARPERLLDTRNGTGAARHAVSAGGSTAVTVTGAGGVPPHGVSAVALNVTATAAAGPGYLAVWAGQTARPATSVVNFATVRAASDLVLAPVGADGTVQVFNGAHQSVQVVADVVGYVRGEPAADTVAPAPVTALALTPAAAAVALQWTDPVGPDTTAVVIRRASGTVAPGSAGAGEPVATLAPPAHAYTDSGLAPNATYSYSVFTRDAAGNISPARSASVALTPSQLISGTVTAPDGTPTAGVAVTAQDVTTGADLITTTGPDGSYRLTGVHADTDYSVCFDPSTLADQPTGGYERQCWPDQPGTDGGAPVAVPARSTRTAVDATLVVGGTVTGTVTDESGAPLAGVGVALDGSDRPALTRTGSDGTYRLTGLVPARAGVCFAGEDAVTAHAPAGHLDACYGGDEVGDAELPVNAAQTVPVVAGAVTPLVDAELAPRTYLEGTVLNAAGHPLGGVTVHAFDQDGTVVTAADGTYRLPVSVQFVANDVCFTPPTATPYAEQCTQLTAAELGPDGSYHHVDVRFGTPAGGTGTVTGTVTDSTGRPLSHVLVTIPTFGSDDAAQPTAYTSATGSYRLTEAQVGVGYQVCFTAGDGVSPAATYGYLGNCLTIASDGDGEPVTTGLVARLAAATAIAGTVRDAAGKPLAGFTVKIGNTDASQGSAGGFAVTDSTGHYLLTGQPVSADFVAFFEASGGYDLNPIVYTGGTSRTGYLDQCWHAVTVGECTPITTTAGRLTAGIDATIAAAGGASGRVTDAKGTPLHHATVYIGGPGAVQSTTTDEQGRWQVTGLLPGPSAVCVDGSALTTPSPLGYQRACYQGIEFGDNADYPVQVVSGAVSSGLDVVLQPVAYGQIAGRVTDSHGKGIAGATVSADGGGQTTSGADGRYLLAAVAPGTYPVCVDPSTATGTGATGRLAQCYGGAPGGTDSTGVPVSAGATTTGITVALNQGGALTGVVRNQLGNPLTDVDVQAYSTSGSFAGEVHTGATGAYRVIGLAAGHYVLYFGPTGYTTSADSGYPSESRWSGGALDQQSAASTAVHAGAASTVDATLPLDGAVAGRVTNETGAAVQGALVIANDGRGNIAAARTRADGTYLVTGVPAGSVVVCVTGPTDSVAPSGATSVCVGGDDSGAPTGSLTVVAGATSTGVDLAVERYATVTVRITDTLGNPLAGIEVDLTDAGGTVAGSLCSSFEDGLCRVDGVLPGTYGLLVHGPDADRSVPARVVSGGATVDFGTVAVPGG